MLKPINHGQLKLRDTKISTLVFETKYSLAGLNFFYDHMFYVCLEVN